MDHRATIEGGADSVGEIERDGHSGKLSEKPGLHGKPGSTVTGQEQAEEMIAGRSRKRGDAIAERDALRQRGELRRVARSGENVMPASIDLAHAGGTTGEWAAVLREEFGEYRAPTGVAAAAGAGGGSDGLRAVAQRVQGMAGGPPRFLVAKPGLDGHDRGAKIIAASAVMKS